MSYGMAMETGKKKRKQTKRRVVDQTVDFSPMQEVEWTPNPPPGFDLVRRLNERPESEPAKRISTLILKIKRLQDLERTHKKTMWFSLSKGMISSKRKAKLDSHWTRLENFDYQPTEQELQEYAVRDPVFAEVCRLNVEIKAELGHFSFFPRLNVSAFRTEIAWIPPADRRSDSAYQMVARVISLAENDWLGWIGQCERCERWFCARRAGYQKFCGAACQQAQYKSSPEWKAHRAQYMRRYRRESGTGGR